MMLQRREERGEMSSLGWTRSARMDSHNLRQQTGNGIRSSRLS